MNDQKRGVRGLGWVAVALVPLVAGAACLRSPRFHPGGILGWIDGTDPGAETAGLSSVLSVVVGAALVIVGLFPLAIGLGRLIASLFLNELGKKP